ncbi:MAG: 2-octaprenylphenol hydroxylase [Lysobacterales bacterium]|jgi:2-octaprenylphenol hydroxylase
MAGGQNIKVDVAIAGGGIVGTAVACLLGHCGFSVALVEAREPKPFDLNSAFGLRVSAISPGSAAILEHAGAWDQIDKARSCAYRRIHIEEKTEGGTVGDGLDFEAPVYGLERLGTIVENDLLQSTLWQVASTIPLLRTFSPATMEHIEQRGHDIMLTLDSGLQIDADLLVGADGAASSVCRMSGIDQQIWDYNQQGVVCVVRKSLPNPGVAWQRFLPDGPIAFLPLPDGSSSVVWTLPTTQADRVLALNTQDFALELATASQGWLGDTPESGPRAAFPLQMRLSDRYVSDRIILLGDSAHVVHPLAGQGVNLGLADAAALVETLLENRKAGRDMAHAPSLKKFEVWRKSESEMIASGIHALHALFMSPAMSSARKTGMNLVSKSWPLKEAFLRRAVGLGRNAPRMCRGENLQSLLRNL